MPRRFSLPVWLRHSRQERQPQILYEGPSDRISENRIYVITTATASRIGKPRTPIRGKGQPMSDRSVVVHNIDCTSLHVLNGCNNIQPERSNTQDQTKLFVSLENIRHQPEQYHPRSAIGLASGYASPHSIRSYNPTGEVARFLNPPSEYNGSHHRRSSSTSATFNGSMLMSSGITSGGMTMNSSYESFTFINNLNKLAPSFNSDRLLQPNPEDLKSCTWLSVYDGVGFQASDYVARTMCMRFQQALLAKGSLPKALNDTFIKLHAEFRDLPHMYESGSFTCALVLIIVGDIIFVANAGNSKAIHLLLLENCESKELNKAHTPDDFIEKQRIVQEGGRVQNGVANELFTTSRALGAHGDKGIIPKPDVTTFKLSLTETNVILLATKGVWDMTGRAPITRFISQKLSANPNIPCQTLAKGILDLAIKQAGDSAYDDMAIVITILRPKSSGIRLESLEVSEATQCTRRNTNFT